MVSYGHNHLSVLLPGSTAQFLPWLEELLWKLETDSLNKFDIGLISRCSGGPGHMCIPLLIPPITASYFLNSVSLAD